MAEKTKGRPGRSAQATGDAFSRRHSTSKENDAARKKYQEQHDKVYKRMSATARQNAREERSPQQQLAALDRRLGPGQGALKERRRLMAEILNQGK